MPTAQGIWAKEVLRLSSSRRVQAVLEALFVTFLWSTSWVLIKMGLREIPALTFAGLRYGLAFFALAPALWIRRREVRSLGWRGLFPLIPLGLLLYTVTQGGQFLTLTHLEAITFSLILSLTPIFVSLIGIIALREWPGRIQWLGVAVVAGGATLYFLPSSTLGGSTIGFVLAALTLGANVAASILGRRVNRRGNVSPIVVTGLSMGVGAALLLFLGLSVQGLPRFSVQGWAIVGWLALANTAVAFTLWNRSLRTLTATESSVINNTMLVQIAVLAWFFLGESLSGIEIAGLLLVAAGTLMAQVRRNTRPNREPRATSPERTPFL